jgi:hypothetical protein
MNQELFQQLQDVTGPLATAMMAVNHDCQGSSMDRPTERLGRIHAFLDMLHDADQVRAISAAMSRTSWPRAYGESPYDDLLTVLRCACQGEPLPGGATGVMGELHLLCIDRFGPPAARSRWAIETDEQRRARFPRLLRAMEHGALLTPGEADATLRVLLRIQSRARIHAPSSSEAVQHFGGCLKVVHAARRWRLRFGSTSRMKTMQAEPEAMQA